jgi:hypothetical protein
MQFAETHCGVEALKVGVWNEEIANSPASRIRWKKAQVRLFIKACFLDRAQHLPTGNDD